jgi:hypothetical protein
MKSRFLEFLVHPLSYILKSAPIQFLIRIRNDLWVHSE